VADRSREAAGAAPPSPERSPWRSPDFSGPLALAAVALAVGLAACWMMISSSRWLLPVGDTDDAMRLVIVRDLLAGRGWFDQAIPGLGPPPGAWLHWSRLLDGGIAGFMLLLRQFGAPAGAEYWGRFFWPLLWVFPGVTAALLLARNLGARSAVFLTAPLLLIDQALYRQFPPGRIDHHNIQIVMTVIALACATARRERARWAIVGGAASALGMAVGLEALPQLALIGASYGALLIARTDEAAPARGYGLTLGLVTAALFAIETPPWRWGMGFCDEIAVNLVAGVAVAGLGLALVAALAARFSRPLRLGLLGAAAVAALAAYLVLDPACIHGPFATLDPRVRSFWFDHIQEVQPLPRIFFLQRDGAIVASSTLILTLAAGAYLLARRWNSPGVRLVAVSLILASVTGYFAWRMTDYVNWIGIPALGAALSLLAERRLRDLMIPSFALALLVSPAVTAGAVVWGLHALAPPHRNPPRYGPRCFNAPAYRELAALPPGMVMAELDLGPFILDYTRQSVVAAPYHRMSAQILALHQAWDAPPALAEARVRALGAAYVVDCPPYPMAVGRGGFGPALRKEPAPSWLRLVSRPGAVLTIYEVLPPSGPRTSQVRSVNGLWATSQRKPSGSAK
jgi:hypothetical protein